MKKILDIPYTCMHSSDIPKEWHVRICGIACTKMILEYLDIEVNLMDLLNEGQIIGAYNPAIGWDHDGLVRLLRNRGVLAYSQEFKSIDIGIKSGEKKDSSVDNNLIEKGYKKILDSIDRNMPIIVSVEKGFGDNGSPHLILITGYNSEGLYFNDPNNSNGEIKKAHLVNKERFLEYWRQFSIFVEDTQL